MSAPAPLAGEYLTTLHSPSGEPPQMIDRMLDRSISCSSP